MSHTRSYIAKHILKSYRIARKQYAPQLARTHAYFRLSGGAIHNLQTHNLYRKYNLRYWRKSP